MVFAIRRVYEPPAGDDGFRVLVDRLWPRGVSKDEARLDLWLKDAGPSTELRTWFGHRAERFEEFERRYRAELDGSEALATLEALGRTHARVTLLFGAKDPELSQAAVLASVLNG
jgi:uncharacterized protein YeaO (DUF488 family)